MINQGLNLEPQALALQVAKHRNWVIERGGESIYAITANGPGLSRRTWWNSPHMPKTISGSVTQHLLVLR